MRKLFKGGNYIRKYGTLVSTKITKLSPKSEYKPFRFFFVVVKIIKIPHFFQRISKSPG